MAPAEEALGLRRQDVVEVRVGLRHFAVPGIRARAGGDLIVIAWRRTESGVV